MEEILHQLRLVVYPIIYRVLYIPGGAGFLPSTVSQWFSVVYHSSWKCWFRHIHYQLDVTREPVGLNVKAPPAPFFIKYMFRQEHNLKKTGFVMASFVNDSSTLKSLSICNLNNEMIETFSFRSAISVENPSDFKLFLPKLWFINLRKTIWKKCRWFAFEKCAHCLGLYESICLFWEPLIRLKTLRAAEVSGGRDFHLNSQDLGGFSPWP